eukprot:gene28077-31184_t
MLNLFLKRSAGHPRPSHGPNYAQQPHSAASSASSLSNALSHNACSSVRRPRMGTLAEAAKKDKNAAKLKTAPKTAAPKIADVPYFDMYSDIRIHDTMLRDKVRTMAYAKAIKQCRGLIEGKIVLDVGCGTGILSMLAAQAGCGTGILSMMAAKAGAAHVYGVDASSIALKTQQIVKDNHMHREDIELPVDKVDVIISEWMGYCLLYENMLESVMFAKEKWLSPDGVVLPDQAKMYIAGLTTDLFGLGDSKQAKVGFWDNVYGFNMKALQDDVCITLLSDDALSTGYVESVDPRAMDDALSIAYVESVDPHAVDDALSIAYVESVDPRAVDDALSIAYVESAEPRAMDDALSIAYVESVDPRAVVTTADVVSDLDLLTLQSKDQLAWSQDTEFELSAVNNCEVSALVVYWDVTFPADESARTRPVQLTTSPASPMTHWQQTVLYLKKDLSMLKGERIKGTISFKLGSEEEQGGAEGASDEGGAQEGSIEEGGDEVKGSEGGGSFCL